MIQPTTNRPIHLLSAFCMVQLTLSSKEAIDEWELSTTVRFAMNVLTFEANKAMQSDSLGRWAQPINVIRLVSSQSRRDWSLLVLDLWCVNSHPTRSCWLFFLLSNTDCICRWPCDSPSGQWCSTNFSYLCVYSSWLARAIQTIDSTTKRTASWSDYWLLPLHLPPMRENIRTWQI